MANMQNACVPGSFETTPPVSFIAANGIAAKIVVDTQPAQAAGTYTNQLGGGCTVLDLITVSSDSVARDVAVALGIVATTQSPSATGIIATPNSNTITRASGSFITDGFRVGDSVVVFAPASLAPNTAVDGIVATVTAVVDLSLTFNGTPFGVLTPFAAGTRIMRVAPAFVATIPASAGSSSSVPNENLLGNGLDKAILRTELKLGATTALFVYPVVAVSALPASLSVSARIARY